jgi:tetratricopeptide (TPR) repeat protein
MRARGFSSAHRFFPLLVLGAVALSVPAIAQTSGSTTTGSPATPTLSTYPACSGQPSKDDSEVAHGAYIAGKRAFDENDYPTAIQYFRDALKRDCTKYELLNIISRAYELEGNRPEAINALQVYLKRAPANDPGAEAIQRRITNLKAQQDAADASAKAAASNSASSSATTAPTAAPTAQPTSSNEPSSPPPPDRGHSAGPWVLLGAGGAAVVTGIILLAIGENDINNSFSACGNPNPSSENCSNTQAAYDKQSQGNTLAAVGGIVGGVGVLAVAGGLIWHFVEPTGPDTKSTGHIELHPDARPGYAGLSLGGAF